MIFLIFFFWAYSAKNAGKPKSRICLASTYRVLATCKVILIKRVMAALESNRGPTVERIRTEKRRNIGIERRKKKKFCDYDENQNGIIFTVKWSGGDNRNSRDTDWLGYTSIFSFFLSLPSFLSRFDEKLTQFQYLFLLFLYF